jgi:hypothetical protein
MGRSRWKGTGRAVRSVALVGALATSIPACSTSHPPGPAASAPTVGPSSNPLYGRASTLSGPVTAGHVIEPESGSTSNLPAGYGEQEFFASGTASAFEATSTPANGRWTVVPTTPASYRTRIIVRRPRDPKQFNGTVAVEWLNESAGESSPDWDYLNPELTSGGFAYVGVSTQALGVNGGSSLLGTGSGGGLASSEPLRYASLHHPGDQYSFDLYAQIGRALRLPSSASVLGQLKPRHIVAVGESQSAFFLTTFANALQPLTGAFDGIFIHSRGGAGASLTGGSVASGGLPSGQRIRTDLRVPVFMFETETDLARLGYASAVQPNTSRIRVWEVAGTSHADSYIVGGFASQLGCTKPINSGPQHVVVQAAFAAFGRWVVSGRPPPSPPPIRLTSVNPAGLARDPEGNAIGGVRTPAVDVPVSTLSGIAPAGTSVICALFGSTTPFPASRLAQLYGTRVGYLARYQTSLDRAISAGYILPADRAGLLRQAGLVQFPS